MKLVRSIPLPRIFAEGAIIVVSILLAFWIDAWWQDRSENIVEVQYLGALREDLKISLESLDESESEQKQQTVYLRSLLQFNGETPYNDDLRRWIDEGLWQIAGYEPHLSSLRELESSGQSEVIDNPDIRRSLSSLRQRLDSLETVQRDFITSQQNLIDPFLVENFDLSRLLLAQAAGNAPDISVLTTDGFRSRVAFKISLRNEVSQSQANLRRALVETLELIDSELSTLR